MGKIKSFTDLIAWQKGHGLVIDIYRVTTTFPREELYGLISQMKRAAVSITSNIAEGFVRQTKKEKIQFYYIALGSLIELESQLLIARDLNFVKKEEFDLLANQSIELSKIINSLIKSIINS